MKSMAPFKALIFILLLVFFWTLSNYLNDPWQSTLTEAPNKISAEQSSWIPLPKEDLQGFQTVRLKTRNNKSRFILETVFQNRESWARIMTKLRKSTDKELYLDCRSWAKDFCDEYSLEGPFLLMVTIPNNASQERRSYWVFEKQNWKMWGTNQKNLLPQRPKKRGPN